MRTLLPIIAFILFLPMVSSQPCNTGADADCDGMVSMAELTGYIDTWYGCSACAPSLFQAITAYYGGAACANDAGCEAAGGFCDYAENMPYQCSPKGDGCFRRTNESGCTGGTSCLNGLCVSGCSASPAGFVDAFDNTDCINPASLRDIVLDGGDVSANGIAHGELGTEPTMAALYHYNNDPRYLEDDIRLAYDFSGDGRNAWGYSAGLFSVDGRFGKAYDFMHNGTARAFMMSERDIAKQNLTIAFWMKLSDNTANVTGSWRFLGGGNTFLLSYSSNALSLRFPNSAPAS